MSNAAIRPSPSVLAHELDGELVLLDLSGDRYYGLDEVGTRVWQLLVEHQTLDPVVSRLLVEFDVDEATLRNDIATLVGKLREAGLLLVEE